ncbi:FkbM family methyltransferase [Marivita sp. S6314]|uniref:FkbM family methyltransferase n=1 Tax=Marivita sp. S6314 TaxID=2926406 RepID=UPI001FF3E0B9|nr:FkbM family methyltransferase [Marivita sp. S6314]MCK0151041.1 FkbM family methyltransferase [Marivita sp. S6314]
MSDVDSPSEVTANDLDQFRIGEAVFKLPNARVVRTEIHGQTLFFAVAIERDQIQGKHHGRGVFYEEEELEIIRKAFRPGDVFADIGTNVGNHALFVAKFLHPKRIVVVEPNPVAYHVLLSNVVLNQIDDVVDLSWVGFGVSDRPNSTFGMSFRARNVGGGRMVEGEGDIPTVSADEVFAPCMPDFVKIDVEGMEMQVLRSMHASLETAKPRIFVEVDQENYAEFDAWVEANGYVSVLQFQRYRRNNNHLLIHRDDQDWSF